jgi:hypothetical protein
VLFATEQAQERRAHFANQVARSISRGSFLSQTLLLCYFQKELAQKKNGVDGDGRV